MTWSNDSCLPRQVADCARQANHFVFSEMRCPAPFAKIFLFSPDPNQLHISRVPSRKRGVAHVTNVGRDAVDAAAQLTNSAEAYGQVVSFWRPNAGVKSAIRSAGDGVKQAWSPGRARSKP